MSKRSLWKYGLMSAGIFLGTLAPAAVQPAGCLITAMAESVTEAESEGPVSDKIATAAEMTDVDDVVEDWMVPIPAEEIEDGVYDVEVDCSSSMFPINACVLAVTGDSMSAVLTMDGTGYLYVYPGTPEEAVAADEKDYIPYKEDADGNHTYTIPVSALDAPVKCAAFSKNKEKWYDRTLVFKASSLPEGAVKTQTAMTTVEELGLEDGTYTVEVTLSGGSGKASVESPAELVIENGQAVLTTVFSSPHYDYVLQGDEKIEKANDEGNSVFYLAVDGFDYPMPITADTTAMSRPHEIDYALFLTSESITKADSGQ